MGKDSIGTVTQVSDKFSKKEFVIITEKSSQYPQYVQFELHQDRTDLIDPYQKGQDVTVSFNIKGRLWNGGEGEKCFNQLVAWKIQPTTK